MLTVYKRHLQACGNPDRFYRRCKCPVWVEGTVLDNYIRRSLKTTSFERGIKIAREIEDAPKPRIQKPKTLEEACASYLADCRQRNLAKESLKKYNCDLNEIQAYCHGIGLVLLCDIRVDTIREFRTTWKNAPLSAGKKLERLRSFFRFCLEGDWIEKNPCRGIRLPKLKDKPTLPFTEEEVIRILAATIDPRLKTFILVLRYTGMRIGDVSLLTTEQVSEGRIFLYTQKTGTPVWIPIPRFLNDALARLPVRGSHYFLNGESTKRETVPKWWSKRLKEVFTLAKVPNGHAHRFRDTFAVSLLERGVPIEQVSVLLGHQNIKITQKHYNPWVKSRQEKLEELVRATWIPEQAQKQPFQVV
jgi:integrase/recombinase XerD